MLFRSVAAADKDLHTQLISSGMEPWVRTPDQLKNFVDEDYARWSSVIKIAKIQAD